MGCRNRASFLYFWEIMDSLQKMVEFTENCKFGMFDIIFQNLAEKGEERAEFFPLTGLKFAQVNAYIARALIMII